MLAGPILLFSEHEIGCKLYGRAHAQLVSERSCRYWEITFPCWGAREPLPVRTDHSDVVDIVVWFTIRQLHMFRGRQSHLNIQTHLLL